MHDPKFWLDVIDILKWPVTILIGLWIVRKGLREEP